MALIGYARASIPGRTVESQARALGAAGCQAIYRDETGDEAYEGRPGMHGALAEVQRGDTLIVTRLDRLAHSIGELLGVTATLERKGAALRSLEEPIGGTTEAAKVFYEILKVLGAFEASGRLERQREGIAKAKANGVYQGRKKTVDDAAIKAAVAAGEKPAHVAKRLGIARSSVYEALKG